MIAFWFYYLTAEQRVLYRLELSQNQGQNGPLANDRWSAAGKQHANNRSVATGVANNRSIATGVANQAKLK